MGVRQGSFPFTYLGCPIFYGIFSVNMFYNPCQYINPPTCMIFVREESAHNIGGRLHEEIIAFGLIIGLRKGPYIIWKEGMIQKNNWK
ncbi:hypothetical protein H5410_030846 [Solanum commersonii]|uniref:Uncharacterized protein n=1 Tax=Solanum commersonii TaxID=4109 RepID=A0A9J5YJX8_SOLCO|nr:hypothetical protein H5410_030846 [Solanum commersonii]